MLVLVCVWTGMVNAQDTMRFAHHESNLALYQCDFVHRSCDARCSGEKEKVTSRLTHRQPWRS
jgi:hypothetical protein